MTLGHPPPPTGLESSRRKAIAVGNQQGRQGSKPSLAKDKAGSVSLNSQGMRVGAETRKRAPTHHPAWLPSDSYCWAQPPIGFFVPALFTVHSSLASDFADFPPRNLAPK